MRSTPVMPAAGAAPPRPLPTSLPVVGADLDRSWTAAALGLATSGPEALEAVAVRRIGSDRGNLGSSYLVELSFARRPPGAPRSVVVKLPALTEQAQSTAARGRLYEREVRFFVELAPGTDVRSPKCYAAGYDEASDTFALVLEDVRGRTAVDQLDGCPVELADRTLGELARLHSSWWAAPGLYTRPWLTTFVHEDRLANLSRLLRDGWPVLCDVSGGRLGADARRLGAAVLEHLPRGLATLDVAPQTLLHGDPRLDNLMFDAGDAHAPVVLLDWQNASRGAAASDVSYFLAQSLTVEDLCAHGDDLVRRYHAELLRHGVTAFPLKALSDGLVQALPVSFAVAASLAVIADLNDPRIHELAVGMAERAVAAADQMGLRHQLDLG